MSIVSGSSLALVLSFMRRARSLHVLIVGVMVLAGSDPLMAYVQNTTPITRVPHRWKEREVIAIRANAGGCADIEDADAALAAVTRAAESWNQAVSDCSYIRFEVREPTFRVTPLRDEEVSVVWVDEGWADHPGHDPYMVALTVLWFVDAAGEPDDGRIVDADISLNDETFSFSVDARGDPDRIDLQSTLVHELGHVLGLDHTCFSSYYGPNPIPLDHLGRAIPRCSEASSTVKESVMYPATRHGSTQRRHPSADDVEGICAIYPAAEAPLTAAMLELPGCNTGGGAPSCGGGPSAALLLLLGLGALLGRTLLG